MDAFGHKPLTSYTFWKLRPVHQVQPSRPAFDNWHTVNMSVTEVLASAPKRCSALLPQVVHVYLSCKHSHWTAAVKRIRREAAYKSDHVENLNEHWQSAVNAVETLIDNLENSLSDEGAGESRGRVHRLCVIDRAEQSVHAAIEVARLQGRKVSGNSRTIAFALNKSTKFYINAMLAPSNMTITSWKTCGWNLLH
jgi:hypothetical protein